MKNAFIGYVITALIMGGGAFYGGMEYQKSLKPEGGGVGAMSNFTNLSPDERQKMREQFMGNTMRGGQGRNGGNLATGEIIAKDDKSITVKLRDGGSKIIFYTNTTDIGKFTKGVLQDLEIGKTVVITGEQNSEGTITAQSIQLRPQIQQVKNEDIPRKGRRRE